MAKTIKYVRQVVEQEGFDYAFRHYSNFEKVEDPEFHKLREAYKSAADALAGYVGCDEESDDEKEEDEDDDA